jgi:hypothetical protein
MIGRETKIAGKIVVCPGQFGYKAKACHGIATLFALLSLLQGLPSRVLSCVKPSVRPKAWGGMRSLTALNGRIVEDPDGTNPA